MSEQNEYIEPALSGSEQSRFSALANRRSTSKAQASDGLAAMACGLTALGLANDMLSSVWHGAQEFHTLDGYYPLGILSACSFVMGFIISLIALTRKRSLSETLAAILVVLLFLSHFFHSGG